MRGLGKLGAAACVVICASGQAGAQATVRPVDPTAASPQVMAAVERANQAIADLQATLLGRLTGALASGGPAAAVAVCRDDAQALTRAVGEKHHVAIGRTSHRLRNASNAPRPWAAAAVASHAGRKVADVQPLVFDLGGRVGVLRPIGAMDMCLTCHGPRDVVDQAIGGVLRTAYPNDQATGFAVGDLRGWIWVEAD